MPRKLKPRPRASSSWTEARYWAFIRSLLRRGSLRWPPRHEVLKRARRPSQSKNKRLKWEFRCGGCGDWFPRSQVEVHHDPPCGQLKSVEDVGPFVERLFCETDGLQVLCKQCHEAAS